MKNSVAVVLALILLLGVFLPEASVDAHVVKGARPRGNGENYRRYAQGDFQSMIPSVNHRTVIRVKTGRLEASGERK